MMHRTHTHILAEWLLQQPEVAEILYPPHPHSPDHELWKTFFIPEYACGLMGIIFNSTVSQKEVEELAGTVKLFGIGFSWGGYESLFLPTEPYEYRSVTHEKWKNRSMARIHVGLESPEDLITDLTQAFQTLRMRA
jgi:cystathionine beta-lyase